MKEKMPPLGDLLRCARSYLRAERMGVVDHATLRIALQSYCEWWRARDTYDSLKRANEKLEKLEKEAWELPYGDDSFYQPNEPVMCVPKRVWDQIFGG